MSNLMDNALNNSPNFKFNQEMEGNEYENFKKCDDNNTKLSWNPHKESPKVRKRWSSEEDHELIRLVNEYGTKNWRFIASHLPGRLSKQCRERWFNQLDPSIKKDSLSQEEWKVLCEGHSKFGNRWAEIIKLLPGRTANQIKNFWNTMMRRKSIEASKKRKTIADWTPKQIDFNSKNENSFDSYYKRKKIQETFNTKETDFRLTTPKINNISNVLPSFPMDQFSFTSGYYFTPFSIVPLAMPYGLFVDTSQAHSTALNNHPQPNLYFNSPNTAFKEIKLQQSIQLSPISNDVPDNSELSTSSTDEDEN